jgi:hypothetical protein
MGITSLDAAREKSLGFTFLGSRVFLDDLTLFPGFDLVASVFHKLREPPGQFVNALRLPSLNGLGWNQFGAYSYGGRSRQDEV